MTYFIKVSFYLIIYFRTVSFAQINFHLTDYVNHDQNNVVFEHDCLRILIPSNGLVNMILDRTVQETLSLCLTESLSKRNIQPNTIDQKLTFDDLRKQNITSEQLYQWSAPIDLIEQYEEYLISNKSSISSNIFYNCTLERFGDQCQYEFIYIPSDSFSLYEIVLGFYLNMYEPTSLTCYTHLKCDRGSKSLCLDWTEICDGYIDCVNDQSDEKFCWELHINECGDDEYQCPNGQCISKQFAFDNFIMYECLDRLVTTLRTFWITDQYEDLPIINKQDVRCPIEYTKALGDPRITSSCDSTRATLLEKFTFNDKPTTLSNICYFSFYCAFHYQQLNESEKCEDVCDYDKCILLINEKCPELIFSTAAPLAFGHIYVGYLRQNNDYSHERNPDYICYNEKLCGNFPSNSKLMIYNNKTCRRAEDVSISFWDTVETSSSFQKHVYAIHNYLSRCNTIFYDELHICNNSLMYHCQNSSKCIPVLYLCDRIIDCDFGDDEKCPLINGSCFPVESKLLFKCPLNNKCISLKRFRNNRCDCPYYNGELCEDEPYIHCEFDILNWCGTLDTVSYMGTYISFPKMCDGFEQLFPILINGTYHTDESECQYWKCNNTYTRCNGLWNCLDGADEIGCDEYSLVNCLQQDHVCIQPITFELMCLPLEKTNDGHIDCLGAVDEPNKCRVADYSTPKEMFYCDSINNTGCIDVDDVCSMDCINENANLFCDIFNMINQSNVCSDNSDRNDSYLIKNLCKRLGTDYTRPTYEFSLDQTTNAEVQEKTLIKQKSLGKETFEYDFQCHHGYPLQLWLDFNQNLTDIICLCPPSYYGNYCQYQNQRISLTLKFQTYSHSRNTLFILVVQLIDNSTERIIHSSKQLTYIYTKHCKTKFNFYLIYSTRPKYSNKTYYIHINIYEKLTFAYRGSLYIPLLFSFLPVHRISYVLTIPSNNQSVIIKCPKDRPCLNGQCMKYAENSSNLTFCYCKSGWSGKDCSISYSCTCSSNSLCVGIEANDRSICICPSTKWGPRCFLQNTICQSNTNSTCLNNGQCVLRDDSMFSKENFFCICLKGFSGDRCEIEDTKILLSFDENITLSEVMLVHFIQERGENAIRNGSTFQSIPLYQRNITIRWPREFQIVLAELTNQTYYLIHVKKHYKQSIVIRKLITSSDHCKHISEYFNETIQNYDLIRRIKYYHLPCQNPISCFYDRDHFCLCNNFGSQRQANCFKFNSKFTYNCFKLSNCQNDGQCIQDDVRCPITSRCICRECFYGSLCQFQSSLFDVSLDGILGSHIQPNLLINHQPPIIKTSLVLVIIVVVIGLINGILSFLAFQRKETRTVGCGYYLLGSTVTTLLTSLMLTLKFSILLAAQTSAITNRTFLNIQCYSFDYLLQICINMDRWLNGCVAIERAINIIQATQFNKIKSRKIAKYIISFLILITTTSTIYDPIHRQLVDDDTNDEQKRIWCIVTYSSSLLHFNQFIHMFHFFIPLLMNIISSLIIIILLTKRQQARRSDQPYYQIFYEQIQKHRHLIIAPVVIIIVSLPRLIISFIAGCMKSNSSPWIYLIGYLVSFIPPMLTFIIFVSPSKLYKDEFRKTVRQYRQIIRARIPCISRN